MVWTHFWDMHSGGGIKEPPNENIFIEAPKEEAKIVFYSRFGHNPERISCTCCGTDYSIAEYSTLEEATSFHRNQYNGKPKLTMEEYKTKEHICIIYSNDIKPEEKVGQVPEQGYVWI